MASKLTPKQEIAIKALKPFALKMGFTASAHNNHPGGNHQDHVFSVECKKSESGKLYTALIDLLPNPDDYKVGGGVTYGISPDDVVDVNITYKNVVKDDHSSVKEVATFLADNGVNFPGSEKLRTRTKPR